MANFDMTAANAALKQIYGPQQIENLVYPKNPFLALVPKDTEFVGLEKKIPVTIGSPQGSSATFATAQTNRSGTKTVAFVLTRKKHYTVARIDREVVLASATDRGSFLRAAKQEIDGAFRTQTNLLAFSLFRSGTGSMAQISSISTGLITLISSDDVVHFEKDQVLQANSTDGGTPRAALGYVVAVDRDAGTVTVSTSINGSAATPSGWAANDFLLMEGNNNGMLSGVTAWTPATAPSSTAFYGVDRSVDPSRLAGVRYDASSVSIEEGLTAALARCGREGGAPDHAFMPFSAWTQLQNSLGTKVQYEMLEGPAKIMFKSIVFNGPNGPCRVIADRNVQRRTAHLLQLDTWCLESLKGAPHIVDDMGTGEWLRVSNEDSYEVRVAQYANLSCNAPGYNAIVTLSA